MRSLIPNRSTKTIQGGLALLSLCGLFAACGPGLDSSGDSGGSADSSPQIDVIDPTSGDSAGGTQVTLTGVGFLEEVEPGTVVRFGGEDALEITVVDDQTIHCVTPAGSVDATVEVLLINSLGTASFSGFTYIDEGVDGPELGSIAPVQGGDGGGTTVTITGARFTEDVAGETSVLFGDAEATDVLVVDDETITCASPAGTIGESVDVSVSNPRGVDTLTAAFSYIELQTDEGDLDGDGMEDLLVGAPSDDANGEKSGALHVFLSGGSLDAADELPASSAEILLSGAEAGDQLGASVAMGDLNSDGAQDLIVGAPNAGGGGTVYVFSGPLSVGSLSVDDAEHVFTGLGTASMGSLMSDRFGASLAVIDMDGDAVVDLLVGAPGVDMGGTPDVGAAYLFWGGVGLGASVPASVADVALSGVAIDDRFGCAVGAGDYNGDGNMELFIGASGASELTPAEYWNGGGVYMWTGPVSVSGSSQDADASFLMHEVSTAMGTTLEVGDVDGDGFEDLVTGAPFADSASASGGGLCLIFRGARLVESQDASAADILLHGVNANGGFSTGLALCDFDGDGDDDVLVTAPNDSYGAVRNGRAFLFAGGPLLSDTSGSAADAIFAGRFRDNEHFGVSAGAVDLDGDGALDICVGALGNGAAGVGAGAVHLFSTSAGFSDRDAEADDLTLEGEAIDGRFGGAISSPE